jgi:superoxide dismutase
MPAVGKNADNEILRQHIFMIGYGLKRADYIEGFFKNINWTEIEKRLMLHKG